MEDFLPSLGPAELLTPADLAVLTPDTQTCYNFGCTEKADFGIEHRGRMTWYCTRCFNLVTLHMLEREPYEGSC